LPGALAELGQGTVRSEVRLADGGVELTRFDARWPRLTAAAVGRARGDGAFEMSADLDADLAGFGPAFGISRIAGRATLGAKARGQGDAIEGTAIVRAPRIDVSGVTVSEVELPFRLSRSTLSLEQARAKLGGSAITAAASATWKGKGSLTAESLARETF